MKINAVVFLVAVIGGALSLCACNRHPDVAGSPTPKSVQEDVVYDDKGRPQQKTIFYVDRYGDRVRHGTYTAWHDNGQVRLQVEYKHGLQDGELTEWYSDGTRARRGVWANGKEVGLWQAWQPTGQKQWEATYQNGKIVGKKVFWLDDKVIRIQDYGDDGVIDRLEHWHLNGTKEIDGSYEHGLKHGTWTYWHSDGGVKATGIWKDGKPWSGVCGIPAAGDAGSWGGIEIFREFNKGIDVGPVSLPAIPSATTTRLE